MRVVRSIYLFIAVFAGFLAGASSVFAASWLPHSLNFPSGISQMKLLGVSCSSTTTCTAVGQDWNGTNWGANAESGWGAGWTPQTGVVRNPGPKNGMLRGVSCVPTLPCVAAGSYGTSEGQPWGMLQEEASGTWRFDAIAPSQFGIRDAMNAISCTSSRWCETVGWTTRVNESVYTFAGNVTYGPTFADSSALSNPNSALDGVSCLSPSFCMAVGAEGPVATARIYNGTKWTATPAPPAQSASSILYGVSCVTSSWCMAVGKWKDSSNTYPLGDLWNGTSWTEVALPASAFPSIFYGVSCISVNECHAVGAGWNDTVPQADGWNGIGWTNEYAPIASGASGGALTGVSCPAANNCEASGWSLFGGTPTGLIETYS